jgi:competence protein ComEC
VNRLLKGTFTFLCGNILFFLVPGYEIHVVWLIACFAAISVFFFSGIRERHIVLWLLAGFLWSHIMIPELEHFQLARALENKTIIVEGVIDSLPIKKEHSSRFEFLVQQASLNSQNIKIPSRIRLSWYGNRESNPQLGEKWQLHVRLKRPWGFVNPGGFDYERWLFTRGIGATGYVKGSYHQQRYISDQASPLQNSRRYLYHFIDSALTDKEAKGIMQALLLGERANISRSQWQLFRDTGTNHLMAISGLHVGLVASFVFFLFSIIWRRSYRLCLWIAAPRVAAVGALIAAAIYAALAGFSIPTQRALIMCAVVLLAIISGRKVASAQVLSSALLLVLLFDPLSTLSPGFWLSFGAVATIFFVGNRSSSRLKNLLNIQWAIFIVLIPLLLLFFGQFPVISPLVNLIAIPYVALIVVPLALATGLLSIWSAPALLLLDLCSDVIALLLRLLEWFQQLLPVVWVPEGSTIIVIVSLLSAIWILAPRGWPLRWLGLAGFIPLLFYNPDRPENGTALVTVLDVGQGLAVTVETASHLLLFDTGPAYGTHSNAGDSVVIPFLRSRGYAAVDLVVVSHSDEDHMGGFTSLTQEYPVREFYHAVTESDTHDSHAGIACQSGQSWYWNDVHFEFLYPPKHSTINLTDNDSACVLKVSTRSSSLLLTSDIEAPAEKVLMDLNGDKLHSTYLVAPHHGSNTSSTDPFLQQVSPEWIFVSAGYHNRFNHPHPDVITRYQQRNINYAITATQGAIQLLMDSGPVTKDPVFIRQLNRAYWRSTF